MVTGGDAYGEDVQLVSPVKVGKGGERRYGMLLANGDRLRLVTERGVELDADRRELIDAEAATSMPRLTFTLRGEQHRYALVAGRPGHDGSGLVAGAKGMPHYAQQASAVPRWNEWLHPRTPEQLAEIERTRQAAERGRSFFTEERAAAGALQTPAWTVADGELCQLRLDGGDLVVTRTDGSTAHLGPARGVAASWSGRGRSSVLHVRSAAGSLSLAFGPPKTKGGGVPGGGSDPEGAWLVVALPVLAFFGWSDRRAVRRRVSRWRSAVPGATGQP